MTKMQVDTRLIRELAALLKDTDLSEIEVEDGERRIRVARNAGAPAAATVAMPAPAAAPVASAPAAAPETKPAALEDHPGVVKSEMVGTVYLAAEPGAANFVTVGDSVAAGDTLLIIEAMKVMNPIAAPRAGKISHVFVENEQPVEYGQPLVIIE